MPNFVIQGGSPGANEFIGDAAFMRDEVGSWPHVRGAVGISTRGRDTGDAQIFIDLVDNPRLDHEYTVFAQVLNGMDVVDQILEGDVIEKIEILATLNGESDGRLAGWPTQCSVRTRSAILPFDLPQPSASDDVLDRVPAQLAPNRLAQALEAHRAAGRPIVDLTESNPTRAGFDYPVDLLAPLADARGLRYAPTPLGAMDARRAVAADFARQGLEVPPDRIVLTASTSEAYSTLFKLLAERRRRGARSRGRATRCSII